MTWVSLRDVSRRLPLDVELLDDAISMGSVHTIRDGMLDAHRIRIGANCRNLVGIAKGFLSCRDAANDPRALFCSCCARRSGGVFETVDIRCERSPDRMVRLLVGRTCRSRRGGYACPDPAGAHPSLYPTNLTA